MNVPQDNQFFNVCIFQEKLLTVSFYFWNKHQMSLLIIKQQNIKNKNMKFDFADLQCVDISNLIADLELVGGANV